MRVEFFYTSIGSFSRNTRGVSYLGTRSSIGFRLLLPVTVWSRVKENLKGNETKERYVNIIQTCAK